MDKWLKRKYSIYIILLCISWFNLKTNLMLRVLHNRQTIKFGSVFFGQDRVDAGSLEPINVACAHVISYRQNSHKLTSNTFTQTNRLWESWISKFKLKIFLGFQTRKLAVPFKSRKITGTCFSRPEGGVQSAGSPGIPLPAAGTSTAFRSSVRHTHWSIKLCSLSISASVLSTKRQQKNSCT